LFLTYRPQQSPTEKTHMRLRPIVSSTALLLLWNSGYAQEKPIEPPAAPAWSETTPAAKARLKIGVALEGGGALGIAHLGVLKWFEEHHIPVDYVAGTSMGD
jgi:NTE family protein